MKKEYEFRYVEPNIDDSMLLSWECKGIGFGNCYIRYNREDQKWHISNECMSREFLKEMLCHIVDNAVLKDDK